MRQASSLLVLAALASAVLLSDGRAQDRRRPTHPEQRFALLRLERDTVQIFDHGTGRLYVVELRGEHGAEEGSVTCLNASMGTIASRPLTFTEGAAQGEVAWPPREPGDLPVRFLPIDVGRRFMVFDTATGLLHTLSMADRVGLTIDPVGGTAVRRAVATDAASGGLLSRQRAEANEAAAIGALKTISTSQTLFREGDKDGDGQFDYAQDLKQLADTQLIDQVLGSGTKQGYVFETAASPTTPEFLWMATARPEQPGKSGARYFVTNQAGVIYYRTDAPFTITPDCEIPPGATPLGR